MSSPRAGGPSRRRSFTPAQKVTHLERYEAACETGQGGAYLRREGLYSSLISEWRRLRDAGLLEGKEPGTRVGRPSAEQAELVRLRRRVAEAEQRELATTQMALELVDERDDQRLRGSSSPAKKIEALRKISLSSSSRRTLAFNSLISPSSSLVAP